jgi:hypothetical protein
MREDILVQPEVAKDQDKRPGDGVSEAEYGESSYWESTSSKQQSQWGSSVVWSSWSKMEKNKGVALEPLENSLTKKEKKAGKLPPPAIVTTGASPPHVINIRAPP